MRPAQDGPLGDWMIEDNTAALKQEAAELHEVCSRVVAVINGKGGVGKTSLVANVGGMAADAGERVLLIDLDPQANLCEDLGLTQKGQDEIAGAGTRLLDAVTRGERLVPSHPQVRPNLDLVAAHQQHTEILNNWFASVRGTTAGSELALPRAVATAADDYDLILIDVPPAMPPRLAALYTARYLVVPTKSDASSLKGMRLMTRQFLAARDVNPDLELLGIVLNFVGSGASVIRNKARERIERDFGTTEPLFDAFVRHAESPSEDARDRGLLAHELERFVPTKAQELARLRNRTPGEPLARSVSQTAKNLAKDWKNLTTEILERIAKAEAGTGTEGPA